MTDDFTRFPDLAAERLGGAAVEANDEFFAQKENLVVASAPIFKPHEYTERGKWMDGWETRRRREPGHDWAVIRLGTRGVPRGVVVDTTHFTGNYPESCAIDVWDAPPRVALHTAQWNEVLPQSSLQGDFRNLFAIEDAAPATHVRLRIFPDGGVARLRVHGEPVADPRRLRSKGEVDLAAIHNGGMVVDSSDMFFGSAHNLIMPGRATTMGEGWETKRRRGPGHDWAIIRLAAPGTITRVVVDTSHFKGNYPESYSLEAAPVEDPDAAAWSEVIGRTKLGPNAVHEFDPAEAEAMRLVRFNIYPDGGVARIRIYGRVHT